VSIEINDGAIDEAHNEAARRILRSIVFFQTQQRERMNVPNTGVRKTRTRDTVAGPKGSSYTVYSGPSKPGEYMHKITGQGQKGVVYGPEDPGGIIAEGFKGRIGQAENSWYIPYLELELDRLGYRKTADDLRELVAAILGTRA